MPRVQKRAVADDSDDGYVSPPAKKSKAAGTAKAKAGTENAKAGASEALQNKVADDDGGHYWELSKLRRVGTSEYKGQVFINIREYYEDKKTGDHKPGKKGISLNLEQYRRLVEAMPEINAVLAEQGHDAPDAPDADAVAAPAAAPKLKPKKNSTKEKKSNIEATSDEEAACLDESDED